jgi:3-hydroxybutyryl-CoA dehydratase
MLNFEDISVGQWVERTTLISKELILDFAKLTGDDNPDHFDEAHARVNSLFRRCVAHGMISASLIAALLGSELPGHGSILMSQNLEFISPVFPEDSVTVRLEILEKVEKVQKFKIKATVTNQRGNKVIEGHLWVLLKRPKNPT